MYHSVVMSMDEIVKQRAQEMYEQATKLPAPEPEEVLKAYLNGDFDYDRAQSHTNDRDR